MKTKMGPKMENQWKRFKRHFTIGDPNKCWNWEGTLSSQGYGKARMNGKTIHAQRMSFILYNGPIPTGFLVCHHCDNRKCVNPGHLFSGTHKDNNIDAKNKGRMRNAGWKGSQLTQSKLREESVVEILLSDDTLANLARKFGVDITCVWKVKHRKSWKHVNP